MPLLIVCGLVLGGVLFYLVTQQRTPEVRVDNNNTVVVQLQGLKEVSDPTVVVFILDGKQYTPEELTKPLRLEVGEHELKIKRKDSVEIRMLTVGEDKTVKFDKAVVTQVGGGVQGGKRPTAEEVPGQDKLPGRAAKEPGNGSREDALPGGVAWDAEALKANFTIIRTSYDSDRCEVSWLLRSKRDTWSGPGSAVSGMFDGVFYDKDDVEVGRQSLQFEPSGRLKQDQAARATLRLKPRFSDDDLLKRAKRVLIEKKK